MKNSKTKYTGLEKAAILMMSVSQDTAGKILALLEDDEIKEISQAMSQLGAIPSEAVEKLANDFNNEINASVSMVGNLQNTERLLRKLLGKEKVDSILEDLRGPAGRNIWDKLSNIGEDVLAQYIKNEYPQTSAMILSKVPASQAANVLKMLSPEFAFEIMKRMILIDPIKKEVLEKVERTLKMEFIGSLTKTQKHDTSQVMAEIFNTFDRSTESKFMEMLESYDTDAAERIKRLMFTFDDIKKIDAQGIQAILKVADKSKLALALKGAGEEIRKKFIDNMSQRAAKILQEEIETMGPVRIKEVDEAQASIITVAKDLISKGEIDVSDAGDADQLIY
ncbi:MAG: flagellar motor switch protein FliG [Alphaproteobacteria bacterium]|jgi:flagellar motor switch protein FliG|nr:flagellar motor switch protein FliG [Candidatus Jidaibacter sp.]